MLEKADQKHGVPMGQVGIVRAWPQRYPRARRHEANYKARVIARGRGGGGTRRSEEEGGIWLTNGSTATRSKWYDQGEVLPWFDGCQFPSAFSASTDRQTNSFKVTPGGQRGFRGSAKSNDITAGVQSSAKLRHFMEQQIDSDGHDRRMQLA